MKTIMVVLMSVLILGGCNGTSEKVGVDDVEKQTKEEVDLTKPIFIEYVDYVQKEFKNDDWVIAVDKENEDAIVLTNYNYYLDLNEAIGFRDLDTYQTKWIALTNSIYKSAQRLTKGLREMGYEGTFSMMIIDSYDEALFICNGEKWIDYVNDTNGTKTR